MSLINKAKVRKLALDIAAKERAAAKFSRVGSEFLNAIESYVRNAVFARVKAHPSKGKTLQ